MSTHNLCFEQKYEKYQNFLSDFFSFLVVKFSIYLNRRVFGMVLQTNVRQSNRLPLHQQSTVDSRYLEVQGTLLNTSRYL